MSKYNEKYSEPGRSGGRITGPGLLAIVAGIVAVAVAAWFLLRKPEPVPIPEPAPTRPLETVAPAKTEEERGDSAREMIAQLKASPNGVDYQAAFSRGQEFREAGRQADAQLLYFFAARGGYGPAALALGASYDPNASNAESRLSQDPDPFQAYKWYRDAEAAGEPTAAERLAGLRVWAEGAAKDGDRAAERLLLQWE